MRVTRTLSALVVSAALIAAAGPAFAHEDIDYIDDGVLDSGKETHNHHYQHNEEEHGHIPSGSENVIEIGNLDLFEGEEQPGRIADVSAYGNYAYLTAFWEPECDRGGVYVVDITDPASPELVTLIPSHRGTFSGEGSQVIHIDNAYFKGEVLAYQNEICPGDTKGVGGVTLVDVTDPTKPKKLVEGAGDFTIASKAAADDFFSAGKAQTKANETHSVRMWIDDGKAYVVLVDDLEATDIDILDITNPSKPKLISETSLVEETQQPLGAVHGDAVFHHDVVVKEIDGIQTMLVSYWDGGYAKLNVNDPANPVFIADTDFAAIDPVRAEVAGQSITPEGNGHQSEFTRDNKFFIATDEDFNPYRVIATMADGTEFTAVQGSDVPAIEPGVSLAGGTRYLGLACDAASTPIADATANVAIVERGVCDFTVKAQLAEAAGYEGVIVFNRTGEDGCEQLVSMLVEASIPAVFVSRTDGFRILTGGVPADYTCDTATGAGTAVPTAVGANGQDVDIAAVFDGWGYVHLYDAGTMQDIDQYYVPESQDPAYASDFGDLSVHEVATDPDQNLAYISYYSAGFRVLSYNDEGLEEVGWYIDEGGNNFWGVEVHKHPNGQKYVLASDRDSGLYILQYDGTP